MKRRAKTSHPSKKRKIEDLKANVYLPDDVLLQICVHLEPTDIARCRGLDTQWHTVCSKDELWEKLFVENFCTDSDFAPSSWFKEFKYQHLANRMIKTGTHKDQLAHCRTFDKPVYLWSVTSRAGCIACNKLILENTLKRCVILRGKQSPKFVHAGCDLLLTKADTFFLQAKRSTEVNSKDARAIIKWMETRDKLKIPSVLGLPVPGKLKSYAPKFITDYFQ